MPDVQLVITPPESSYLSALSPTDSDATLQILALHNHGDGARGILELRPAGAELESLCAVLEQTDAIVSHAVVYDDDTIALLRYRTTAPSIYSAALGANTVPIFPVQVANGRLHVALTTSYDNLSQFGAALTEIGAEYEVVSLRNSSNPSDLLTHRQQEFVTEAVNQGYYDTPRSSTLTELATAMDLSKGAASRLLHRAEERIVKEFVSTLPN